MLTRLTRVSALSVGAALVVGSLASCGGSSSSATVSGAYGKTPKISFSGSAPSTLSVKTLKQGTGPVVKTGTLLVANYLGQIWGGKVFDSSFARHQLSAFPIGVGRVIPAWDKTLVGKRAGSRLLLVVPPVDGYGVKGDTTAGITGTDTLTFVVDLAASYGKSAAVTGPRIDKTVDGIHVVWPAGSPPTVHLGAGFKVPKKQDAIVVARGHGKKVVPGLVVLQYVVVNAKTGGVLYSTWKVGIPDGENVAGTTQPSLLNLFLGLPVGTRVLLRIPKASSGGPFVFAVDLVAEPSAT